MKKFIGKTLVFWALMAMIFNAVSVEAAKKSVAVLQLENVSGYNAANVADIMAEELTVALLNSGRYNVVERNQISNILKEQGFQNIAVNPNDAVQVGQLAGVNYSVIGKVTLATIVPNDSNKVASILGGSTASKFVDPYKGKVSVDIRFVDNETGALIFAKSFEGSKSGSTNESCLHGACKEAAENFLKELSGNIMGRIAEVSDKEVYIDLGADSGIRKGDTLLIVRETDPIVINDKIVGMKTITIGKVKVTEVNAEHSVCKIDKVEKGNNIRKGDVVKRG